MHKRSICMVQIILLMALERGFPWKPMKPPGSTTGISLLPVDVIILLPVRNEKGSNHLGFVALQNKSNLWVIKYSKYVNYHPELFSATGKLGCHLTCSDDQEFQFLYHSKLNNYIHDLTPSSMLNISSQTAYENVVFTQEEATALRHFLFQYWVSSLI